MVLCPFSRPGDLKYDASADSSSSTVLGSNRKAVVKRLDSCLAQTCSSGRSTTTTGAVAAAVPPSGRASAAAAGWVVGKVSDSW